MPRFPLPPITESTEELLEMRRGERDERRRERLHLLWLLASGAVTDRLSAAKQLGRNRETVSRWLADYARGGLAALLRAPRPPGPPHRGGIGLPAAVQDAIRARLAQPRANAAIWRCGSGRGANTPAATATRTFIAGYAISLVRRSRWRAKATDKKRRTTRRLPRRGPERATGRGASRASRPAGLPVGAGREPLWPAHRPAPPTHAAWHQADLPFRASARELLAVRGAPAQHGRLLRPGVARHGQRLPASLPRPVRRPPRPSSRRGAGAAHGQRRRAPRQGVALARAGRARLPAGVRPGTQPHRTRVARTPRTPWPTPSTARSMPGARAWTPNWPPGTRDRSVCAR